MAGVTSARSPSTGSARDWVPALCATEATWLSLALDTLVNGSPTPRAVSLPYLALGLPMTAAAVLGTLFRRRVDPAWCRWLVLGPLVVLATVLTAGAVAALSFPGITGRVMTQPWSLGPVGDARFAGGAWLFAVVAWGRGTWLGSVRIRGWPTPSARSASGRRRSSSSSSSSTARTSGRYGRPSGTRGSSSSCSSAGEPSPWPPCSAPGSRPRPG